MGKGVETKIKATVVEAEEIIHIIVEDSFKRVTTIIKIAVITSNCHPIPPISPTLILQSKYFMPNLPNLPETKPHNNQLFPKDELFIPRTPTPIVAMDETLSGGVGRRRKWQRSWQWIASISVMGLLQICVV